LQSELLEILDRGNAAFLVMLDLSAAFDTVNHSILLDLMNSRYQITGTALRWFTSYLQGRTFRVRVNNQLSEPQHLPTGVPQGSVLGPLLFNMFSSGMASIFEEFQISAHYYADDTQFLVEFDPRSSDSESAARGRIAELFDKLALWMSSHHLKLNPNKTVFLLVIRDERRTFQPLVVGSYSIAASNHVRNLGFIFNRSLSLDDHISYLKRTTFYHLRRIDSIRHCVSFKQREILVHSFITSRVDFCNSLFYGCKATYLKSIGTILSSAAKALLGVSRRSDTISVLKRLHWLPIQQRIIYKIAILGYNIVLNSAPSYFSDISILVPARNTRSSASPLLTSRQYMSKSRLVSYGDRSCFYSVCEVFNSLPSDIRAITNFREFKSKLKTYLFSNVY
jgi:hypothetical protein